MSVFCCHFCYVPIEASSWEEAEKVGWTCIDREEFRAVCPGCTGASPFLCLLEGDRCEIKHALGGQTCIRKRGHDGLCSSKAERGAEGTLTYSEWESRNGAFYSHVGYRTIYPANAACP